MPRVVVERLMVGADADAVWAVASDLLSYPAFMDQVLSVEPLSLADGSDGTAWTVLFNGNQLQWTEHDILDRAARKMAFVQVDGDLAEWRGNFEALPDDRGVRARYEIEFDLGIPALAHILHPLGEGAIRANCEQMLQEMEARSGTAQAAPEHA